MEATASRLGWRPSLLGGGHRYEVAAIASSLEIIAIRFEAMAPRLEAIGIRLDSRS